MAHFGSKIRALRAERGWSQDELARRGVLVLRNTVKKIERTVATPEELEKNKLCLATAAFEIDVDQLVALYKVQGAAAWAI